MDSLAGKRIVLGVTGSIAAFKAAEIASTLVRAGASVRAVLTPNAARFITPVTMRAITAQECLVDLFDETAEGQISHIRYRCQMQAFICGLRRLSAIPNSPNGCIKIIM